MQIMEFNYIFFLWKNISKSTDFNYLTCFPPPHTGGGPLKITKWYAGKLAFGGGGEIREEREALFIEFANFCGVNNPTMLISGYWWFNNQFAKFLKI